MYLSALLNGRCARDTLLANGIWKSSLQKMSGRANAISEVLTAIVSSIGSSGGMTELIRKLFSNNLYSLTLCWVFQVYCTPTIFHPSTCSQDLVTHVSIRIVQLALDKVNYANRMLPKTTCLAGIYNVTEGKSLQVMASKQINRRQPAKPIFLST
jgi:hypothetical protein